MPWGEGADSPRPSLWGIQYGGLLGSFQPCLGSKRRKNLNSHREPLHSAHKDLRMLPSDNFPLPFLAIWSNFGMVNSEKREEKLVNYFVLFASTFKGIINEAFLH